MPIARSLSRSCAPSAASAPPPSTSGWQPSPRPAASSGPPRVIASPATDNGRATIASASDVLYSAREAVAETPANLRAAQEGAARLNLRLLAKVIAGQFQAGRLVADEFLHHAERLALLSRDEVVVIGMIEVDPAFGTG